MTPIKILLLTANPPLSDEAPLRLGAEVRTIEEGLRRSEYRDRFQVIQKHAVRAQDLRRELMEQHPQIVHFSGHGSGEMGLLLETDSGKQQIVRTEALAELFGALDAGEIECVLLNACYSEVQAKTIHQFVDCVIGMNDPIGDKAGIEFSTGFYEALGAGKQYDEAFKFGQSAIALSGSRDQAIPVQLYRKRRDAVAPALRAEPESVSQPEPVVPAPMPPSNSSQSFGNITINGSENSFNAVQAEGDVTIDQSRTETTVAENPELQAALEALAQLKEAIASTDAVGGTEKKMAAIPIEELEAELQKPEPQKNVVDQTIAVLQRTFDGVAGLTEPVAKVAGLVAKLGVLFL